MTNWRQFSGSRETRKPGNQDARKQPTKMFVIALLEATIIFPNQLYRQHPALKKGRLVVFTEDHLFFQQLPFHKHKLILHRASMQCFQHELEAGGYKTMYVDSASSKSLKDVISGLAEQGCKELHYANPVDYLLERRLQRFTELFQIRHVCYESPNFLCDDEYLTGYFDEKKRYFLTEFYIAQRKRFDILLDKGSPVGGKWTYDQRNRKKLPKGITIPKSLSHRDSRFVTEAKSYVEKHFQKNPGNIDDFNYPVTTEAARENLLDFIHHRLHHYGAYQDAIDTHETILFHSLLTPALNTGLLSPHEILQEVLKKASTVPINSLEGFIRQVIGWREFIRAVYQREGVKQRTNNHWGFSQSLPQNFWDGHTGIMPVDNVIQKALRHAYSNHIERLMVIGNFMLLCEINPDEVYGWFMSLYIDAYDWVMVPNVYGMSQYADGGLMSTKPYISGSNYLLKMSRFKRGEWCAVWDSLYWMFILKHREEFARNPRMTMMVKQLNRIDASRLASMERTRERFLEYFARQHNPNLEIAI